MRDDHLAAGNVPSRTPWPRKSARVALQAQVILRRSGQARYCVTVHDISRHGCCLDFVELPRLDERVWVKFDGLEPIEALVCWTRAFVAGLEFERAIHPAVFAMLVKRLQNGPG